MDCVICAGGLPKPGTLLYAYTNGLPKATVDINGRPMLEYVVNALQSSKYVEDIAIAGLGSDMGMTFLYPEKVHHLPDAGSLVGNALAGVDWLLANKPKTDPCFLACTSDIPTITGAIVDELIEKCRPFDKAAYYNFVTKETIEARFPNSNRTYIKLKGVEVAGSDINMMRFDIIHQNRQLWETIAAGRKQAWKLANIIGLRMVIKLLLRQLTFAEIEQEAGRVLGRPVQIILNTHAEVAMDGDKPHQIDLLRADLQKNKR